MRRGTETAHAESFPFELLDFGDRREGHHRVSVGAFGRSDQDHVVALEPGLYHGADVDDGRIAGDQRLGGQLAAAKENQFGIQAVLAEKAGVFGHPDMDLVVRHGGIADFDLFNVLRACRGERSQK